MATNVFSFKVLHGFRVEHQSLEGKHESKHVFCPGEHPDTEGNRLPRKTVEATLLVTSEKTTYIRITPNTQ